MTLTASINFKVRPLYDSASKESLQEINQAGRDVLFYGDSMEKKSIKENQALFRSLKKQKTIFRKVEKQEEVRRKTIDDARLRRGEGSEEKKQRSEANGKENLILNPYLKKY